MDKWGCHYKGWGWYGVALVRVSVKADDNTAFVIQHFNCSESFDPKTNNLPKMI